MGQGGQRVCALSPRAARVFLSAADTWYPPGDASAPGASQLDLVAPLAGCLAPGEDRTLPIELWLLEWLPRLGLRRRGFCWLPRPERSAFLERLERCPVRPLRQRVSRLRAIVDGCYQAARAQTSSRPA